MPIRKILSVHSVTFFAVLNVFFLYQPFFAEAFGETDENAVLEEAGLEECIETALANNRRRPASRYAVEMAEAQHRQALAGYWPQIGIKGDYHRMDEAPNFIVSPSSISLPMDGSIAVTIPGSGNVPVRSITVPAQDIKLMDKESFRVSAGATWLLYDGGMRKGYREQTGGLVDMMKQETRRTDLEIIDSVRRLYYGSVLAIQLHQIGRDTLARMEATLNLTETMYKEGGGMVKRTDWLENKVMVDSLRSMVALLEKNKLVTQVALANTMGMPWHASIKPLDTEIPFEPFQDRLDGLVSTAYMFNPDWGKVEASIRAAEGAVRSARSGYYPRLMVTGTLHKWWNDHDAGLATDSNKEGWSVGAGVEIPIFTGFLTKNKMAETRAQVAKIKEEQFLLKEGIGLRIRDTFLALDAAVKSHGATLDAMMAAEENRDLNTRAYQHGLVETENVIRSQLVEALMAAQHYKTRYDHIALRSQLNLVVGNEVLKKLEK